MDAELEFRVLGPVEARRDGVMLPIGAAYKPRLVLAALLTRADQNVPVDWLVDVVWGTEAPASARRNVQLYVHRLRTVVGQGCILSIPSGYVVRAGDRLDSARFRRLAAAGSAALDDRDAVRAGERLRAALDLWRGPAYTEFTDCPPIADEAAVLDELRLTVSEQWAEAELMLGHHGLLVEPLSNLVRAHPYREGLCGQLMRALYGTGRQADALQLYRTTQALLADQLGVEPGPQLQHLHLQMLRGDPQLTPQCTETTTASSRAIRGGGALPIPRELPGDVPGFAGREHALKALDDMLPGDAENPLGAGVISAVVGTAGVGKTALAVYWAHRIADRFPDGQLYLDLCGYASGRALQPIDALTVLLGGLGVPPRYVPVDVPAAAARYRSLVAGRRMLIVLDNAQSSAQVRPLLPASSGCLVLITSRDRLTGLVAQDGARRLALDVLFPDESVDMLGRMLGGERVAAEPAAAAQLALVCAHLPLALRIAGAGLADQPRRPIADYVAELTASGPVAALALDGGADIAIRRAFDLSYRAMPQPARQVFRRLGLVPCPDFTAGAAAALAGMTESEARGALDRLAAAHLVVQHRTGRYTLHDLLRQYAADRAATEDSPTQRIAAVHGLQSWFVGMSVRAAELLSPEVLRLSSAAETPLATVGPAGAESALDWLDAERHNLVAAILHAARHGPRWAAWMCADALRGYYDQRRHLADWLSTARAAVAAARADGDPRALAAAYLGLANTHFCGGHYRRSITYLRHTVALATEAGWDRAVATAYSNLGIALMVQGQTSESIEYLNRALQVHERIDWPAGRAKVTETLANAFRDVGRLHEGCHLAIRARAHLQAGDTALGMARADASLGELYALLGRLDDAAQLLASALTTLHALRSRQSEAMCLAWLARVHCDLGLVEPAGESAHAAVDVADEVGEPRPRAVARHALALVHHARGDHPGAILLNQAALAIAEQGGLQYCLGEALLGLASAHHSQGDHHVAIDHASRALTLAQTTGYAVIEGRAHTTLGRAHHQLGNATRALEHANHALTNHRRTGHRIGEADTHLLLAAIQHHLGDHTTADRHANTAWSLYAQIRAR